MKPRSKHQGYRLERARRATRKAIKVRRWLRELIPADIIRDYVMHYTEQSTRYELAMLASLTPRR